MDNRCIWQICYLSMRPEEVCHWAWRVGVYHWKNWDDQLCTPVSSLHYVTYFNTSSCWSCCRSTSYQVTCKSRHHKYQIISRSPLTIGPQYWKTGFWGSLIVASRFVNSLYCSVCVAGTTSQIHKALLDTSYHCVKIWKEFFNGPSSWRLPC